MSSTVAVSTCARALLVLQVACLVWIGLGVARQHPVFGLIDESGHDSYAPFVAEQWRLPPLKDLIAFVFAYQMLRRFSSVATATVCGAVVFAFVALVWARAPFALF